MAALDLPVEDLKLSVRAYNRVKLRGICTAGDLARCTERELTGIRHFGPATLAEVRGKLAALGLELGETSYTGSAEAHEAAARREHEQREWEQQYEREQQQGREPMARIAAALERIAVVLEKGSP